MLGKLLKHDFRATSRLYLPIILGFVGMSIINKISFELDLTKNFSSGLLQLFAFTFMFIYILAAFALAIVTHIFIAVDFYKSMTGNQGYLTHTLPVKTTTLIHSKLILAVFWQIVTGALIMLSILFLFAGHVSGYQIMEFWSTFKMLLENYAHGSVFIFFLESGFIMLIGVFYAPLMYYVSIAIGHLFQKHRLGASILAYFAIYFIIQIISSVGMSIYGFYYNRIMYDFTTFWGLFQVLMWAGSIFSILTMAGFYGVTWYVFHKKLNLN